MFTCCWLLVGGYRPTKLDVLHQVVAWKYEGVVDAIGTEVTVWVVGFRVVSGEDDTGKMVVSGSTVMVVSGSSVMVWAAELFSKTRITRITVYRNCLFIVRLFRTMNLIQV